MNWFSRWRLRHKPFSVAIQGRESGVVGPPLTFLRFRSVSEAQMWISMMRTSDLSRYVVVDLRRWPED